MYGSSSSSSSPPSTRSLQTLYGATATSQNTHPAHETPPATETTPLRRGPRDVPRSAMSFISCTVLFILLVIFVGLCIAAGGIFSRVPRPTWVNITPSQVCSSIGARVYTATSSHMPQGFYPDDDCLERPIEIHGRKIQPLSCTSVAIESEVVEGNSTRLDVHTLTTAEWLIDFSEPDCIPTWDGPLVPDSLCAKYGTRWYTAQMPFSRVPPGLDRLESCHNTSGHNAHAQSALPQRCKLDSARDVIRARFKFDEEPTCSTAHWTNVRPDYQCKEYGKKRYTGILKDIPEGLNGLDICKKVRYPFFGLPDKELAPEQCEVDNVGGIAKVSGSWTIDFRVPECRPVVRDLGEKECVGTHWKRVEGWLDGLGKNEDQSHMCMTTPIVWDGVNYLPRRCEARRSWNTYQWASYHVWDPRCH